MDPRLLEYYNRELAHLREMGAEFAAEFPKVAARLGMEGLEVADPYVERLLEGFAFIAGRIQLKIDAEFPRFTQHLLEIVYPHYLSPTPSLAIVDFKPDFAEPALLGGVTVPAGTRLRSIVPRGEQTPCHFRSAHDVVLWPFELVSARYFSFAPDLPLAGTALANGARAGLRLRLRTHAGARVDQVRCNRLTIHLNAADEVSGPLYELLQSQCIGGLVQTVDSPPKAMHLLGPGCVREVGFDDSQALLPIDRRSFHGYRLLREYFAFPQRFHFAAIEGLAPGLSRIKGSECEIVLLFGRHQPSLETQVDASMLSLYATPAANLFARRADRVPLADGEFEHHLVVDRGRPMDFEVFSVSSVRGLDGTASGETAFTPFYGDGVHQHATGRRAYYVMRREPRRLSERQRRGGSRTGYVGSEVFLSLVDERESPYPASMTQLAVDVLATNRDLPLLLPIGSLNALTLEDPAPVESLRIIKGPTRPRTGLADGDFGWRLLSHLSLNYLSLFDDEATAGGSASRVAPAIGEPRRRAVDALREILGLYADLADPATRKQVEAITAVSARPLVRRLPMPGPITFGRGLGIDLSINETGFGGGGGFLLGAVLEKFFARYVSLNSFTQTRLVSESRGEVASWPARTGSRIVA